MAAKQRDPFPGLSEPLAAEAVAPEPSQRELDLMERIKHLESQLASKPAAAAEVVDDPTAEPNYTVSVLDAPTLKVHAKDPANALATYMRKVGMLQTMHTLGNGIKIDPIPQAA